MDVSKFVQDRIDRLEVINSPIRETIDLGQFSRVTVSQIEYPSQTQTVMLKSIEQIFQKKLAMTVRKWQDNTLVETKLERIRQDVEEYSPGMMT